VGVPEKPTKAETSVCKTVRVHASLTTALSSIIADEGTRGVQELEEDTLSRYDTMRGANDLEVNPLPRENTMGGVREFKEDSLSWLIPREVLKRLKKTRSRGPIQREV